MTKACSESTLTSHFICLRNLCVVTVDVHLGHLALLHFLHVQGGQCQGMCSTLFQALLACSLLLPGESARVQQERLKMLHTKHSC